MIRAAFFALLLFVSHIATADDFSGQVVRIADGDTITVLDANKTQHKIRLAGIDAPERKQPYGEASRKHLASLIAGKTVSVEWSKRDKYRRIVGVVVYQGMDVNLEQIKMGYAWHYKKYEAEQTPNDRMTYADAEQSARIKHMGLWKDSNPMPPWDWRKTQSP